MFLKEIVFQPSLIEGISLGILDYEKNCCGRNGVCFVSLGESSG
jgi:hypothetical protein